MPCRKSKRDSSENNFKTEYPDGHRYFADRRVEFQCHSA